MDASSLARDLDNLEKSWSSLDWWLNFWTILVVIGVALELIILVIEYAHEWRDFKRGTIHAPDQPSILVFGLGFLGVALVAGGVAGEFWVHVKAGKIESDIRSKSRELVGIANSEAGNARKDASRANERSRQLEKDNLVLQAEVLNLRLRLADRHLTVEQQTRIARSVCTFGGRNVSIGLFTADNEMRALANDMSGALPENCFGKIGFAIAISPQQVTEGFSGIQIVVRSEATATDKLFADALAPALRKEGLKVEGPMSEPSRGTVIGGGGGGRRIRGLPAPQVEIAIGRKP